jgi:pimeloyl-ACP methyl ester carboxylesterase
MIAASKNGDVRAVVMDSVPDTRATIEFYMHKWVSVFARPRRMYESLPDWVYWALSALAVKVCQRRLNCTFPSLVKALRRKGCPVFIIHGVEDGYVDVSHADFLFEVSSQPKELWLVPGARHNEGVLVRKEEYQDRVADFFGRAFPEPGASTGKALEPDTLIGR